MAKSGKHTVHDVLVLLNAITDPHTVIGDFYIAPPTILQSRLNDDSEVELFEETVPAGRYYNNIDTDIFGDNVVVGKFLLLLEKFQSDLNIHSIRIKGANNMLYVGVHESGLVIHD